MEFAFSNPLMGAIKQMRYLVSKDKRRFCG